MLLFQLGYDLAQFDEVIVLVQQHQTVFERALRYEAVDRRTDGYALLAGIEVQRGGSLVTLA